MADRIDLLGRNQQRERLLGAGVLEVALKSDLTDLVRRAVESSSYPISIISLMGRRSQFFAASTGLPPELLTLGGTDRSVSLCQRTVRDNESSEWEDASLDDSAPQGMVNTYGIRAYFGAPVVVQEVVIGSLCVVDTSPRARLAPLLLPSARRSKRWLASYQHALNTVPKPCFANASGTPTWTPSNRYSGSCATCLSR